MFFDAQKRFNEGKLFDGNSYQRDLLQHYGNAGRAYDLPKMSRDTYERGLKFRYAEKEHYSGLEQRLQAAEMEVKNTRERLRQSHADVDYFANFVNDYLKPSLPDAPSRRRQRGDRIGRNSGGDALPAAGGSDETDTQAREVEATISSTSVTDEPPNTSRRRPRGNNARSKQEEVPKTGGQDSAPGTDAGRALPDAPDEPEPDVGGSAAEHDAAE